MKMNIYNAPVRVGDNIVILGNKTDPGATSWQFRIWKIVKIHIDKSANTKVDLKFVSVWDRDGYENSFYFKSGSYFSSHLAEMIHLYEYNYIIVRRESVETAFTKIGLYADDFDKYYDCYKELFRKTKVTEVSKWPSLTNMCKYISKVEDNYIINDNKYNYFDNKKSYNLY